MPLQPAHHYSIQSGENNMDKLYGWTGKILRVDLSAGTVTTMNIQDYLPAYVGGLGIAARIAWDELKPGVGSFDPENMLFVMVGPLTGTVASGAGRVVVAGIAPQQNPSVFSRSGVGGHWGAELKYAGYDGIVIQGAASTPVYLWIEDGRAELRDAGELWGRGTFATSTLLRQWHGPATRVMSCGPAGENLCRIACMQTETGNAAGQGGYGAVMGSKRLKAIAVRGTGGVPVADPGRLMELALGASREGLSYRRGSRSRREQRASQVPAARHRKKCGFCASNCSSYRYMAAPNLTSSGSHTVHPFCYGFRQDPEASIESAALAGDLGLNGWETAYGVIPWLQLCKQHGLIDANVARSALDGIEIPVPETPIESLRDTALTSAEFTAALLHKMAYREGEWGDALADGACYAAERLFGGQGLPLLDFIYPRRAGQTSHWNAHWIHSVRFPFLIAPLLQWCVDTRDPASDAIHGYAQHMLTYLPYTAWEGEGAVTLEQARAVCEKVYGEPDACDPAYTYDRPETKIVPAMYHHHRGMINNCMVLCERETIRVFSLESEDYAADTALMAKLYEAATGEAMSEVDLDRVGERVFNLLRAIDVRNHGRVRNGHAQTRAAASRHNDWATVESLVGPSLPDGIPLDLERFGQVLDRYYEMRGWNPETGWPTRERLERLGLGDVADGLERVGKLG
jgi:aldehyde:ferredoxin oxidoreductase